ncbi:MAG: hypothetical protein F6K56_37870 [Moorea sp. SIO3G5]|nr:hypothetical protein [Moorena sp. SIO3G5]
MSCPNCPGDCYKFNFLTPTPYSLPPTPYSLLPTPYSLKPWTRYFTH